MFGECHCHISLNGIDYSRALQCHSSKVNDDVIRTHLEQYQKRDIHFIRDGGDGWGASMRARELAPEYEIDYRTPLFAVHKQGHYGGIVGRGFETLKEYAALVDEAACQGADFIKIMTTGIMSFDTYGSIIAGAALEANEVKEMVHIAHEEGFAVMSHTNGRDAVLIALEAGVDSIEHGNFIDASCIEALAQSRTAYIPTATVARNLYAAGIENQKVLHDIWNGSFDTIRHAYDAGVILALGSDAGAVGVLHGQGTLDEYACFKKSLSGAEDIDARLQAGEDFIKTTFCRH